MTSDRAQVICDAFALYNEGKIDAMLERYFHEDVEVREPPESPDAQVYLGCDGYRDAIATWLAFRDDKIDRLQIFQSQEDAQQAVVL